MAPNLTLQQQQAIARAKAKARAAGQAPSLDDARTRNEDAIARMADGAGVYRQPQAPPMLARPGGPQLVAPTDSRTAPFVAQRDNASAISAMGGAKVAPKPGAPGYRPIQTPGGAGYQRLSPTMDPVERSRVEDENKRREIYDTSKAVVFGPGGEAVNVNSFGDPLIGAVDKDIGMGIISSPIRAERGIVGGLQAIGNIPSDIADFLGSANKPEYRSKPVPRLDFSGAQISASPDEFNSITGGLVEGLAQFIVSRKLIGSVAPGGGVVPQLGKDAIATFGAYEPVQRANGVEMRKDTNRVADMVPSESVPEGPLRDYLKFLKSQPDDSPILARFKNTLEDMTLSGSMVAPQGAIRAGQAINNALTPQAMTPRGAGGARPIPARPSPQPAAPATPQAPQASPVAPAQPRPPGAGQMPNAGNAAPPVLNATPVAPQGGAALAKSDAKDLARMMRFAGVPRNDVMPLLADLVHQFNLLDDPRARLKFFAAEHLPQKLPKPVADAVLKQFDAFGFQQLTEPGPGAGVMTSSIDEIRNTQKGYLEDQFNKAFGKEDIVTKTGKLKKLKSDNADAIYRRQISDQQANIDNAVAAPEQITARDNLLQTMSREDFFKKIPEELDFAAKNEGFGGLWEYVHQKPLESAHWLQSKLGYLERSGSDNAGLYAQMRKMILKDLEDAVPGYRGARMQHGDAIGQELAKTLGNELRAVAGDRIKLADLAKRVAALPASQKKIGRLSVKEMLKNEFRKVKASAQVDPVTGQPIDAQSIVMTQLQKDGLLDALETVFPGKARGKVATSAIRKVMRENEGIPQYRSDTAANQKKQSIEALRSPTNKLMQGVSDKTGYAFTIPADLVAGAVGAPPVFTASKIASDIGSWASKPNPKRMARTAKTLYGTPPASSNVLNTAPRRPPPRRGGPTQPQLPPTQETLDDLLRQYDAVDPGANPAQAEKIRKRIVAAQKQLASQPALSGPPKPPANSRKPNKAGMGGAPEAVMAGGGGVAGYYGAQDTNGDGVVDDNERRAQAVGGMFTGAIMARAGRAGVNKFAGRKGPPVKPSAPIANAEKILADPRIASQLTPEQYKPLFDSVSAQMQKLQNRMVHDSLSGRKVRYDSTQAGSDEIHRLNGLLMNYFRTADGGMDFDKVFRWAEKNDPDRVLRVKAGRMADDVEDGVTTSDAIDMTPDGYERTSQLGSATLKYSVGTDRKTMTLDVIEVPPAARGQKEASKALDALLAEADANKLTVYLDAKPIGSGGMTKPQLEQFYAKRGFTKQAGGTGMVRSPNGPKPPPAQAGFGQFGRQIGPPRPPGMKIPAAAAQKGQAAPTTVKKGPRNVTVSPEIAEQMKVVRKANADERKAMRKNVMRPDRDELNAPWTEARIAEEEKLADMQAKERARRVGRVARRSTMQRIAKHPTTSTLVGGAGIAGAYIGFKTAFPQKQEEPENPSRPGYWFEKIATKDSDTVSRMQRSLHEWGFWPTEKKTRTNGYKLEEWKEPVAMNGRYGTATKDAMKRWLYEVDPYRDPDEPITQEDVERLLAGPKGYQDDEGHWQNPRDRKPIAAR